MCARVTGRLGDTIATARTHRRPGLGRRAPQRTIDDFASEQLYEKHPRDPHSSRSKQERRVLHDSLRMVMN